MNKGERNEKAREIAREKKLRERQAYILQFVGGQVPGGKRNLDRRIRDYLIGEANYACTKCGYDKLNGNGKPNLEIIHKNDNPYDHYYDNLQVLCRNCHGEVTVHKGKGTGRGRNQSYPPLEAVQPLLDKVDQKRRRRKEE